MKKAAANGVIASHSLPAFSMSNVEQVGDKTVSNSALGGKKIQFEGVCFLHWFWQI